MRVFLILLVLAGAVYFISVYESSSKIKPGKLAPDFSLIDRQGNQVRLKDLQGTVVLINLWATWCPPCAAEMPSLDRLQKILQNEPFRVLAVSVDENERELGRFLSKNPMTLTVLHDPQGDVATLYGTNTLPESFLIDRRGVIVKKYVGPRDWTQPTLVQEIKKYLEE